MITSKYADDIINRLKFLGYEVTDNDVYSINFICEKVENHIKNVCNICEIPDGLKNIYVDMVCGEFLQFKHNTGQLADTNFDVDNALSSVTMGDVSMSFDKSASVAAKFASLIDMLINSGKGELLCYRKIRW